MAFVQLTVHDPIMYAKCSKSAATGPKRKVGHFFGKAYSKAQWEAEPVCDNCGSPMELLYSVKLEG